MEKKHLYALTLEEAVNAVADQFEEYMRYAVNREHKSTFAEMCEVFHLDKDAICSHINDALVATTWTLANRRLILTNRVESVAYRKFVEMVAARVEEHATNTMKGGQ